MGTEYILIYECFGVGRQLWAGNLRPATLIPQNQALDATMNVRWECTAEYSGNLIASMYLPPALNNYRVLQFYYLSSVPPIMLENLQTYITPCKKYQLI